VYATKDYRKVNNISVTNTFINVISRAKEVTKTTDRLRYWSPAIKLWLENPIFGGGGDSFGWQYKIYYYQKNAKYKGDKSDTLKISESGTAHNLYLQTLVGKGIFGLISLLGVIFIAIFGLIKKELISQKSQTIEGLVISLSILGSLFATLIYANVQEIFYIQSISVIFWLVVFIGASISFEHSNKKFRKKFNKIFLYISIFMLLLLPFHIFNISYVKEYSVDYFNSISLP
jgi:O-antigen ligase